MFISWKQWLFAAGALLVCTGLLYRELTLGADGRLHLHVLDVGQGDGILLVSPSGKQIVIDGGEDLTLLEHLGKHIPFFDRTIELLVVSHFDADHITALPDLLKRYHVERVLMTGALHKSGRYEALLHQIASRKTEVIIADPAKDIDIGDGLVLDVLWPESKYAGVLPDDPNNPSVVLKALFKEHSILLSGDIEEKAEAGMIALGSDLHSDVLKAPHHGSRTSSSTGFLLAVNPDVAIISAGRDNKFGHPHTDVLERYEQMNIDIRQTNMEGTISLEFE